MVHGDLVSVYMNGRGVQILLEDLTSNNSAHQLHSLIVILVLFHVLIYFI